MPNPSLKQAHPALDAERDRQAYNAAFGELGLTWFWDSATHHRLQGSADERERIRSYLTTHQSHLLKAYEADFLVNAIHLTKQKHTPSRTVPSSPSHG